MAVVREFTLPDLGEGLTEATIVHWMVEVGEVVAIDQPVVEVETAKAMVEVPCPYGGVVTACFGAEGEEVPVGAPLVTVAVGAVPDDLAGVGPGEGPGAGTGAAGGAADAGVPAPPSAGVAAPAGEGAADAGSGNVLVGYGTSAAAARRRRIRPGGGASPMAGVPRAPGGAADGSAGAGAGAGTADRAPGGSGAADAGAVAAGTADVTGENGPEGPAEAAGAAGANGAGAGAVDAGSRTVAVISPLVRRMARENGLDLRELTGSGRDGLILRTDVECAIRARQEREPSARAGAVAAVGARAANGAPGIVGAGATGVVGAASAAGAVTVPGTMGAGAAAGEERIPLKGMLGAAAEKFSRSRREIPEATCWVDADATELLAARRAMNVAGAPKVSLLALLARITTAALARFPELNATVDTRTQEIVRLPAVHLGFAAQTDRGLVVPVVRDAQARTVEELSAEITRLTETARSGGLSLAELTHGTFTLNNYGVFGVDGSTPIINHPEAAMLGVGRIAAKPWVHEGELAVRQVVQLSLTFDHRVCDGGTAGGFLRHVADCVEQPALLLRGL
ncbi:dihydrolipoamide acetyltransferase family protein [Streptomyces sp. DSM 41527]|uniref:Dihydrolipoamide acetyltransferase component of pyruvate dehydrogenase complex n=1 Tax=Streptomyces mooreae TaxID=3075523 RepID=A0ABU2T3J1_9ACTN|nr:dihydrolipoamide acetyltransferase family protein [Streptomyces sp. DSM 41527]MDT0455801.1 dihydrolipoamide acetyltransferase family protein [Streptomyces sp. DSM 41527]